MRSDLHNKILTRGYWQVLIRPVAFIEKRLDDISSLFPLVEKSKVSLRGWDFPHIDYRKSHQIDLEWVGQEFEWQHHKSVWRFFQSGQFFHVAALPLDWRDESTIWPADANWKAGTLLGIGDTIANLAEIFEFAARLALSKAGDDLMRIAITVGNLQNRHLYVDSQKRWPLDLDYSASIARYPYVVTIERSSLISSSKDLAAQVAMDLFKRFQLGLDIETIRSWQDDLRA
jgi:hypothetical protein